MLTILFSWATIPKIVGSIPTVDRHIFQACPVWIYTQSNITCKHHLVLCFLLFLNSRALPKKKRKSADDNNNNHFVQTTLASSFLKSSTRKKEAQIKPDSPPKLGCEIDNEAEPECCELMIFVLCWVASGMTV
jgi:hypothetical protein